MHTFERYFSSYFSSSFNPLPFRTLNNANQSNLGSAMIGKPKQIQSKISSKLISAPPFPTTLSSPSRQISRSLEFQPSPFSNSPPFDLFLSSSYFPFPGNTVMDSTFTGRACERESLVATKPR